MSTDAVQPDPVARFVEQRESNDCWNACVASLFGLPYEAVADMPVGDGSDPSWRRRWTEWFRERGYTWWDRPLNDDGSTYFGFGELTIACGKSPRTVGDHCVLWREGEVVWDPHPQREMGLGRITTVTYLLPIDPALSHSDQPATQAAEQLREAAAALLSEGGLILADRGGNPVCWLCKAHLDGEYAHRDGFPCAALEQALATTPQPTAKP